MHAGNLEYHLAAPEVQVDREVLLGMVHLLNPNHLHLNNHRKSGLDGAQYLGGRKRRRHPPRPLVHPLLRLSSTLGIKFSLGQLGNVSIINALILLNSDNVFFQPIRNLRPHHRQLNLPYLFQTEAVQDYLALEHRVHLTMVPIKLHIVHVDDMTLMINGCPLFISCCMLRVLCSNFILIL